MVARDDSDDPDQVARVAEDDSDSLKYESELHVNELAKPSTILPGKITLDDLDRCHSQSSLCEVQQARHGIDQRQKKKKTKHVSFDTVQVREYSQTVGDNPCCSYGPPVSLDWGYECLEKKDIILFEAEHRPRRSRRGLLLNYYQRRDILLLAGHTPEELEAASRRVRRERFRRSLTVHLLPVFVAEEKVVLAADRLGGLRRRRRRSRGDDVSESDISQWSSSSRSLDSVSSAGPSNPDDPELGRVSVMRRIAEPLSLSMHSLSSAASWASSRLSSDRFSGFGDGNGVSEEGEEGADPYAASQNSMFERYHVRVDHGQNDRATEIALCRIDRPHMRAFHASWFSFFVAFFTWFAVTPLLSEIKDSLNLTKRQIWTSSLCGTAGTIVVRIALGPACDNFGARICMAFVLAASAIPCALTGLVQTAEGLSIVRSFVGVAGASFVACQCWTSSMFSREVAGTANAAVAGWGNLGGGITQLVMGTALFPLFKVFYGGEDDESREQAWRTVFVVPAVVSIIVAVLIVRYCDDSPKGDYRERVRQQEINVVSPFDSFRTAILDWNVWVLAIQYACCFGVEVTMTNATALYFSEQFDQRTESASAIASTFGFCNLFARGLGGLGSDAMNTRYGMKGRLAWQVITLCLQGGAIILFGFADTMVRSIFALICTSVLVQSAEGSTFGIVPYISRRYTGGVVGIVGAGGNVGGVIFALFFRQYHWEKAFFLMGITAAISSILSFTMHIKGHDSFITCGNLSPMMKQKLSTSRLHTLRWHA